MKKFLIIANPKSGKNRGQAAAEDVFDFLSNEGKTVELRMTESAGHATDIAAEICANFDVALAVGGDGTASEVARGILKAHSDTPLGIIPIGTANVVARELGIPRSSPRKAAQSLLLSSIRDFDIAFCNNKPFLANTGVGFDADVVAAVHRFRQELPPNKRFRMLHYIPIGFSVLKRQRAHRLFVRIDDTEIKGNFTDVIVCNTRNYGGIMSITPDALPDDGLLNFCLRKRTSIFGIFRQILFALIGWKDLGAALYLQGRRIEVRSSEACTTQIDGDPAGDTPLDISIGPKKIGILSP